MMSVAFLTRHTHLNKLMQKFCEPGHSSVQEVDNLLHSQIEQNMLHTEVFSALGVVSELQKAIDCYTVDSQSFSAVWQHC